MKTHKQKSRKGGLKVVLREKTAWSLGRGSCTWKYEQRSWWKTRSWESRAGLTEVGLIFISFASIFFSRPVNIAVSGGRGGLQMNWCWMWIAFNECVGWGGGGSDKSQNIGQCPVVPFFLSLGPNGQTVPYKLSGHGSANLTVEYMPREVGEWTLSFCVWCPTPALRDSDTF